MNRVIIFQQRKKKFIFVIFSTKLLNSIFSGNGLVIDIISVSHTHTQKIEIRFKWYAIEMSSSHVNLSKIQFSLRTRNNYKVISDCMWTGCHIRFFLFSSTKSKFTVQTKLFLFNFTSHEMCCTCCVVPFCILRRKKNREFYWMKGFSIHNRLNNSTTMLRKVTSL